MTVKRGFLSAFYFILNITFRAGSVDIQVYGITLVQILCILPVSLSIEVSTNDVLPQMKKARLQTFQYIYHIR